MSILDDAIREHLELKRQHGAPDDELKKLEDEAFGPPARPDELNDPLAEAPTEFMLAPEAGAAVPETGEQEQPEGRRVPDIADLQEAPPAPEPAPEEPEAEAGEEPEPPAVEDHPAAEHEVPEIEDPAAAHTTQERHAIAEQPTEMFDVEGELAAEAPAEAPAPSDEELLDSELEEPRLQPEPAAPAFDDDDDFFDEQRLSDELDQALEAPATEEEPLPPASEEPVSEEHEQPSEEHEAPAAAHEEHEDVLEDTPDFLEESPEDDQLWFEQKPPKDFDFDD